MKAMLGARGAEAPSGKAPTIDAAYLDDLVRLSLTGLERMYDPAREALFSVTFERGRRETVEHLGLRYTVMSSLGIHQAKAAGYATTLDAARLLQSGLAQHDSEDIDHLAMALWADAHIDCGVGEKVVPRLLAALDRDLDGVIGRVLAWALTALALQHERDAGDAKVKAAATRLRDLGLHRCWHAEGGLFDHFAGGSPFWRTQALFSTQIYWVYALATYGRVFGDAEAAGVAERAADQLIALRDPFHGWPWRYDAPRGRVAERYPVYSVHQDAMAPMALHAVTDATGRRFDRALRESVGWLHRNELGVDLVDRDEAVVFRAIRRVFPLNRAAYGLGWAAAFAGARSPVADRPWALRVNRTCRPYHLGWILHAWAGRTDRVG
ncbi:MAG: hypothetical protein H6704_23410 [Myxococcales bacterium]|nr:hypothetical protein [Myxococcales bacterium]